MFSNDFYFVEIVEFTSQNVYILKFTKFSRENESSKHKYTYHMLTPMNSSSRFFNLN